MAERLVAAENEGAGGLRGLADRLREDHGGEAAIGEVVEVFGDSVEGDEILNVKVFGEFKNKFRMVQKGFENAESAEVQLVRGRLALDPVDRGGVFRWSG